MSRKAKSQRPTRSREGVILAPADCKAITTRESCRRQSRQSEAKGYLYLSANSISSSAKSENRWHASLSTKQWQVTFHSLERLFSLQSDGNDFSTVLRGVASTSKRDEIERDFSLCTVESQRESTRHRSARSGPPTRKSVASSIPLCETDFLSPERQS